MYMPPSEAEKHGYERASKHPKSTKFGRQNPISERWNSEEQLVQWRKAWADVTNRYLKQYGQPPQPRRAKAVGAANRSRGRSGKSNGEKGYCF